MILFIMSMFLLIKIEKINKIIDIINEMLYIEFERKYLKWKLDK